MSSQLYIEDYSEKSIVVRGETRKYSEQLKKFSGLFNSNLRGGAGWIYSKNKREEIQAFINSLQAGVSEIKETVDAAVTPGIEARLKTIEDKLDMLIQAFQSLKTRPQPKSETIQGDDDKDEEEEQVVRPRRLLRK